jgi:hypothetical protein
MEAFIVVPPLNPWDKPADQIMLEMGMPTMSRTAGEAWRKHTRGDPSKVQFWHDRGYRLRRVRVDLLAEAA